MTAHKVVNLPDYRYNKPTQAAKHKVGLFIFACCSYYLYRQAAQAEMNRLRITGLRLHMYPFAPPPLFFKCREAFHLVTRSLLGKILPYIFPSDNSYSVHISMKKRICYYSQSKWLFCNTNGPVFRRPFVSNRLNAFMAGMFERIFLL